MYSDPKSMTLCGGSRSLPRIMINGQSSTYRSADGKYELRISHSTAKNRVRHLYRVDVLDGGTNPLTGETTQGKSSVYVVVDNPAPSVFAPNAPTDFQTLVEELLGDLTANTSANLVKLLGSEI